MIRIVSLIFSMSMILACSSENTVFEEEDDLLGTWLLIEQYADPGDGSGGYVPVDSDKTITFLKDGTFQANGTFCDLAIESDESSGGTFAINDENLQEFSPENFMTPENCTVDGIRVFIHFEGENLILSFLCIEGCGQKYRKL